MSESEADTSPPAAVEGGVLRKTGPSVSPDKHPSTAVMVLAAIKALDEKKGTSLQAIKKYVATNYTVDIGRMSTFICKFLNSAVVKGLLVRTNGTGAVGRFKMAPEPKKKPAKKAAVDKDGKKKPAAKKKPTSAADKTSGMPKKKKSTTGQAAKATAAPVAKKVKKIAAAPLVKPSTKTVAKANKVRSITMIAKPAAAKKAAAPKKQAK